MRDIHSAPIDKRIKWIFEIARHYSETFRSAEAWLARERYAGQHPTTIVVLKCMDGRINVPVATNTPAGIIRTFSNLGGIFDLGWPYLGEVIADHVLGTVRAGRGVLLIITYHWSKGDIRRGCTGFQFDTAGAIAHTYQIRRQIEHIFGFGRSAVYPLVCGFETDEDALVIHGTNGTELDLSDLSCADVETLEPRVAALLPDMPTQMRVDFLPLLVGNLGHIARVREQAQRQGRTLEIEHREWMICLGRGFDFLHVPNQALIIGPYSPDLADPLRRAAGIIEGNMKSGRIPEDGFLLLTCAPYDEIGVERARAELKSRFLSGFAEKVLNDGLGSLAEKMTRRTAVLDGRSRTLELIED